LQFHNQLTLLKNTIAAYKYGLTLEKDKETLFIKDSNGPKIQNKCLT